MTDTERPPGPSGIGGWLILPLLGLVVSPLVQLLGLTQVGDTVGSLQYLDPAQSALVIAELILNAVLFIVVPIVLLILAFGYKRTFPRSYIWWQIVGAVFVAVDLILAYVLFASVYRQSGVEFFDRDTIRSIGGAVVGVAIWVPYMQRSVRVKNTFVK